MGDLGVRGTGVLARIGLGCSDTPTERQFDAFEISREDRIWSAPK
jgi:hypothetical protein